MLFRQSPHLIGVWILQEAQGSQTTKFRKEWVTPLLQTSESNEKLTKEIITLLSQSLSSSQSISPRIRSISELLFNDKPLSSFPLRRNELSTSMTSKNSSSWGAKTLRNDIYSETKSAKVLLAWCDTAPTEPQAKCLQLRSWLKDKSKSRKYTSNSSKTSFLF